MLWSWLRTLASGLVRVSKDFCVLLIFAGLVMNPKSGKFTNKLENVSFWFLTIYIKKKNCTDILNSEYYEKSINRINGSD